MQYFFYEKRLRNVEIHEVNSQLQKYFDERNYVDKENLVALKLIKNRLKICGKRNNMMINVNYFL
jgi:hypothetical protein